MTFSRLCYYVARLSRYAINQKEVRAFFSVGLLRSGFRFTIAVRGVRFSFFYSFFMCCILVELIEMLF